MSTRRQTGAPREGEERMLRRELPGYDDYAKQEL
jgi:hypothetical protein